jgi:single-strand DNA-binding protein
MSSRSLNRVDLIGNLGNDPELRKTNSEQDVCNFRLATNESWKDKDGNDHSETEWHNIVVWGKLAVICGEHLKKGSQVYIEGKLKTRKWKDNEDRDRYTTETKASKVLFLDSKPQKEDDSDPFNR